MTTPSGASPSGFRLARNIILVGFLFNLGYALAANFVFELDYPHTTFLFRPLDRFQDFYTVLRSTAELDPYRARAVVNVPGHGGEEMSNYFPFTHIVLYPFTWLEQGHALVVFFGLTIALYSWALNKFMLAVGIRGRTERAWSWLVFLPLNYPVLFTFDRGNIELWVFAMAAAGIYLYERARHEAAGFWIGAAASFKLFPFVFLFTAIKERRWKPVVVSVAVFGALTLFALSLFEGGIVHNIEALRAALFSFGDFLLIGGNGVTHTIGFFSAVQALKIWWDWAIPPVELFREWRDMYNIFGLSFLFVTLAWTFFRPFPRWKVWAILCALVQLVPFPSYDYKLLYTLIPLGLVLLEETNPVRRKRYVWLLALTCVPKMVPWLGDVRISCLINPILITATLGFLLFEKYEEPVKSPGVVGPRRRSKIGKH